MKQDEFAFLNLQLAGMLRSGIPLEGALRQLCATMQRGGLRAELQLLEADLSQGTPLREALPKRRLPDFYRQMIQVGIQSNDLPGVLTLVADYYQKVSLIGTRLKGLMIYPLIVLLASMTLSFLLASIFRVFSQDLPPLLEDLTGQTATFAGVPSMVWMPVIVLTLASSVTILVLLVPQLRRALQWRLPGFKEAGLSQLASAMGLMLKSGNNLSDALGLLKGLESKSPVGRDITLWQARLAGGHAQFPQIAAGSKIVPPLFSWLVNSGGEDMAEGFRRAAEIYYARAVHRIEMLLYAALPVAILFLGVMLISQAYPLVRIFIQFGTVLDRLGQ
jgi:type II secretory pathway component PulF